ncbi:hypothetical protein [Mycobacteroides abscessus]|uniref:hypothetical protein n=1 Tax=Mycobacteroides abscessus TaxID=36809 RepID=UPI001F2A6696|nr:hypothetical protein [Mycobacteroides abscessus]
MPDGAVLGDLALVLGEDGVPEGLVPPVTRFESVGFTACGLVVGALGVPGVLGDSGVGALALGIGGSWWGSTAGWSPWLYAAT